MSNNYKKKAFYSIALLIINFVIYYLISNKEVEFTFEEISISLVATIIAFPILTVIPALFIYILKLYVQRVFIPFKNIYLKLLLNLLIAIYSILIVVAILIYFRSL